MLLRALRNPEFDEGLADPGHPTHVHCHRGIPCRVVQMRYIDDEVLAALRIQRVLIKSLPRVTITIEVSEFMALSISL